MTFEYDAIKDLLFHMRLHQKSNKHIRLEPGITAQKDQIEMFNRTFREELLGTHLLNMLDQERNLTTLWLMENNETPPHQSTRNATPKSYAG